MALKQSSLRKGLITACCALSLILVALIIVAAVLNARTQEPAVPSGGSDSVPQGQGIPQMEILSVEEQGNAVFVETTYGSVSFPSAFADLIVVEGKMAQDHATMLFSLKHEGRTCPLFSLSFGKTEGIMLGKLQLDGAEYSVTAAFFEAEGLSGADTQIFQAAQETCNEVFASLENNAGFVPAD